MEKENKIRVLVLRVGSSLEEVEVEKDKTLEFLQEVVDGYVDVLHIGHGIDIWLNDEGLLREDLPLNFVVGSIKSGKVAHQICGNVVFASHDREGNTISLTQKQMEKIRNMFINRVSFAYDL